MIAINGIKEIDNTNYYLVATTIILASITLYYAIQTQKSVKAIENSTKAQFRPYLKASIFFYKNIVTLIRITNAGKGAAQNIEIIFSVKEIDNTKKTYEIHVLLPEGYNEYFIPISQNTVETKIEYFRKNQVSIVGEWKCEDILGNTFEDSINLDVTSHIKRIDQTATKYEES